MAEAATQLRLVPRGGLCAKCQVRTIAACAVLDEEEIARLEAISRTTEFDRGEIVFEEGEEAGSIYNLTDGAIRLFKLLPNGRRQIVGFSFPGDMLGLANHGIYTCSAEA
ncbi:MAG: cyclic nucleotide-binding domain-containing protein, partial [Alphaproteobacteria bacterium]|nr:cyclic nucleotide-binding domain-containing protein [Alphaproteobacteria bacterium]